MVILEFYFIIILLLVIKIIFNLLDFFNSIYYNKESIENTVVILYLILKFNCYICKNIIFLENFIKGRFPKLFYLKLNTF